MNRREPEGDKRYDRYLEERAVLINAEAEGARSFDKAILTVASGAFLISIAFLKDVVPLPLPETKLLMLAAWVSFAVALLSILLSFLTSQAACRAQVALCYDSIVKEKETKSSLWNRLTHVLNGVSITAVVLGFCLWALFVYRNL